MRNSCKTHSAIADLLVRSPNLVVRSLSLFSLKIRLLLSVECDCLLL
ncbi:hypothetical protein [Nostoc sp. FACHB-892]|nr:hypothetical protein [Nostoc sp. FACHB-892]